jgi:hypothetical protein
MARIMPCLSMGPPARALPHAPRLDFGVWCPPVLERDRRLFALGKDRQYAFDDRRRTFAVSGYMPEFCLRPYPISLSWRRAAS